MWYALCLTFYLMKLMKIYCPWTYKYVTGITLVFRFFLEKNWLSTHRPFPARRLEMLNVCNKNKVPTKPRV